MPLNYTQFSQHRNLLENSNFNHIIRIAKSLFGVSFASVFYRNHKNEWIELPGMRPTSLGIEEKNFCLKTLKSDTPLTHENSTDDHCIKPSAEAEAPKEYCFYAGHRITDSNGDVLGVLCLFDEKKQTPTSDQVAQLKDLTQLIEVQIKNDSLVVANQMLKTKESALRQVFNAEKSLIQCVNSDGKFLFTNQKWHSRLGYSPEELNDMTVFQVLAPKHHEHCQRVFQQLMETGKPQNVVTEFVSKTGEFFPVSGVVESLVTESGKLLTRGVFSDLTSQTLNLSELTKSFDGFDDIAASLSDVFWLLDVSTHKVLYVSPAYEKVWGRSRASLYANRLEWHEAIVSEDRAKVVEVIDNAMEHGLSFDIEFRILNHDNTIGYIHNRGEPVFDDNGNLIRLAGVATDITERKQLETTLRKVAETDDLTGLMSRKRFAIEVERVFERSQRAEKPVAMAIIDLDHFKRLNDNLGHSTGDSVLMHFADVLRKEIRSADIPARIGGDEFCVILEGASVETTQKVMQRVIESFGNHTKADIPKLALSEVLSCSIGIAQWQCDETFADLRERADAALYASKNAGRGIIRVSQA